MGLLVDFYNQFFAHYREPVMRRLESSADLSVTWIADIKPLEGGIPAVPRDLAPNILAPCRTLWGRVVWQSNVVGRSLRTPSTSLVFTGDVTHLSTWLGAAIARLRGKSVLMWTHGWTHMDYGFNRPLRKAFYSLADALLVYADDAIAFGRAMGYRKRMYVIGNSMGAPLDPGERAEEAPAAQRWLVVSRLIAARRLDSLVAQVARLRATDRLVDLNIVGDGPEREALERLSDSLGLREVVHFHGALYDGPELVRLFHESDILVSPGNVGLAAVHAMSYGCPVATHDSVSDQGPEHQAVIADRTGVRFPHGDWDAMADSAWEFVATHNPDEVGRACVDEIRARWTPEAHACAIERALQTEVKLKRRA